MTEIDDLLERIETPATEVGEDVARGRRALRRRQRWQVAAVVVSVLALAGAGIALDGRGHASPNAGFSDQPGARHDATASSPASQGAKDPKKHRLTRQQRMRRELRHRLGLPSPSGAIGTYHDVLAEHLDPHGDLLAPASNEQSGGNSLGTKFDWNHGGMLEIVVGKHWNAAGSFYLLENAGLRPTTYDGRPARVSTTGSDTVVSVEHADGTVVTLIASTSFGNNGTSTASTHLTQHELLAAAADERLVLPPGMG